MAKIDYSYLTDRMVTVRRIPINASAAGNNTVILAVPSKILRVYQMLLISSGSVNVRFESGASGTPLTGFLPLTASTGFASGWCPVGHFETVEGDLLNLELSAPVSVGGWLICVEV